MPDSKPSLKQALLSPLKAVSSRDFYFTVLFRMKGTGFLYLFLLCVVLAIPAAWRTASVMHYFKSLDLPRLVAQIPASYLDASGTLVPDTGSSAYAEIRNAQGQVVMVYNAQSKKLEGEAARAPIELGPKDMIFHNIKGGLSLPYVGFFPTGTAFQPVQAAQMLEGVLGSSTQLIWSVVVMSMYVFLIFNAFLSACLARFMMVFIFRIKTGFGATLRLCSYANTLVAFLMVAQFFVFLPMSYTVMVLVPLVYVALFAQKFRAELAHDGIDGFARRYGGRARVRPGAGQEEGPRRDTSVYSGNMYAEEQERRKREAEGREKQEQQGSEGAGAGEGGGGNQAPDGGSEGASGAEGGPSAQEGSGSGSDDDGRNGGGKGTGGYFEA
jgi:hypothetical protein